MICELCKNDSRIIYSTSKYGEICNNCMCEINNSEEGKKLKELETKKMMKKYGVPGYEYA